MRLDKFPVLKRGASLLLALAFCLACSRTALARNPMATVAAESAILMDLDSGQILFEKNMNQRQFPASITKVMTALLALENASMDETVTMTDTAVFSVPRNTSHIALDTGEQIPMLNAMYAMLLPSANDAANGIAEHVGGSLESFAEMMNRRAAELGAVDTHFVNPSGLPDANHYTTAYDMALITREAVKHPELTEIWGTEQKDIPATNKNTVRHLWNQVELVLDTGRHYDACTGGKLGWTQESLHTLVAVAERDGRRLLVVLLRGEQLKRNSADAIDLFDYGFDHTRVVEVPASQLNPPSLPVYKKDVKLGDLFFGGDSYPVVLDEGLNAGDVEISYELPDDLEYGTPFSCVASYRIKAGSSQYADLGSQQLRVVEENVLPVEYTPRPKDPIDWKGMALTVGKFLLYALGGLVALLFLLVAVMLVRKHTVLYLRRRRRRKQQGRRPPARPGERPNASRRGPPPQNRESPSPRRADTAGHPSRRPPRREE